MHLGTTLETNSPLAARAKAMLPLLDEWAPYSDREGQLSPDVIAAFHRDGMFKMWVPEALGGSELSPTKSLEVLEISAYGDASAGWVQMAVCLETGTAAAYLGDTAIEEMFTDDTYPVIGGQGTRPGTATVTDGGYLVSGSWSFASGLKHGTHIHTLAIIEETGEPRIFVLPTADAELLMDSWNVMGLRGTGSIDYNIDNAFVAEDYTHFAFTREAKRGGALYNLGIIGMAEICHAGWAMGVGRRMLDELAALAQSKTGRAGSSADSDAFHQRLAEAEAKFRAARALVFETWRDIEQSIADELAITVRQDTMMRLSLGHITSTLLDVANFVYLAGGTAALYEGTLERLMRDVHAGTQHVTSSPSMWQNCGRELLGLAPGQQWILLDLVDAS
jgi:alkylation response protein AidB-like acyl-CoA dehydrogenase